jgi:hypothetical protein
MEKLIKQQALQMEQQTEQLRSTLNRVIFPIRTPLPRDLSTTTKTICL